jgi:excisionase family DNA binding protein
MNTTKQANRDSAFLTTEDVAGRFGVSVRKVRELTRHNQIPHRVLPFGRRILFEPDWLEQWQDGAELETVPLAGNGRIVRPIAANGRR